MEKLELIHWLLAFAGMVIHIIMKLSESPGALFESWTKKDFLVSLASLVAIPVLLIIMTDTALSSILPINYVTAFLVGYQTQSFLRSLVMIAGKKYNTNEKTDNNTSGDNSPE